MDTLHIVLYSIIGAFAVCMIGFGLVLSRKEPDINFMEKSTISNGSNNELRNWLFHSLPETRSKRSKRSKQTKGRSTVPVQNWVTKKITPT